METQGEQKKPIPTPLLQMGVILTLEFGEEQY